MAIMTTVENKGGKPFAIFTDTETGQKWSGEGPLTEFGPDPKKAALGQKNLPDVVLVQGKVAHKKCGKKSVHGMGVIQ